MITISMPVYPDNYYGHGLNASDLSIGDIVYVGPSAITTPAVVEVIHDEPEGFVVITDKYKLLVGKSSRVNIKAK